MLKRTLITICLLFCTALANQSVKAECTSVACLSGGGGVLAFNPGEGALLGPILDALLPGSSIDLGLINYENIAGADINLNLFLELLAADLGVGTPAEVLTTDITLLQFLSVAADAVEGDGNLVAAQILNQTILAIPEIEGLTIPIGELLIIDFDQGDFTDVDINLLELVTGGIQLFNYENAVTSPEPYSVNTAPLMNAFGLNGVASQFELYVQVVEPPTLGCAEVGTVFRSPAMRIKLDIELLDVGDATPLLVALRALLGPLADIDVEVEAGNLEVYVEVGSSQATVSSIDLNAPSAVVDVQPGVATAWLGHIPDDVFFNTHYQVTGDDVDYAQVLSLNTDIGLLGVPLANTGIAVEVKAHSLEGRDPEQLVFTGPFPQTLSTSGGTSSLADLIGAMLENLDIRTTLTTPEDGAALDPLLAALGVTGALLLETIDSAADDLIDDAIILLADSGLLETVIDPILNLLGVGLGPSSYTLDALSENCRVDGYVYVDENTDKRRQADETGSGIELYAKLIQTNEQGEQTVTVVPVDPVSGYYRFDNVPAGDAEIIISTNDSESDLQPSYPAGWVGTEAADFRRNIRVSNLSGYNFGMFQGVRVAGTVFQDNGEKANDGLQQANEAGIGNSLLRVFDAAGNLLNQTRTAANGEFELWFAYGGDIQIQQTNVPQYSVSTGADLAGNTGEYNRDTDVINIQVNSGDNIDGLAFADVPSNQWLAGQQAVIEQGGHYIYSHRYTANTEGRVVFDMQESVTAGELSDWQVELVLDVNCDGIWQSNETLLAPAYSMQAGETLCVLAMVHANEQALENSQHSLIINADFNYANASPLLAASLQLTDLTRVLSNTGISLDKKSDREYAKPGDIITFTLHYKNSGSEAVVNAVIHDSVPTYTEFVAAACDTPLPATITACRIEQQGQQIFWYLDGELAANQSGSVTMQVRVQ